MAGSVRSIRTALANQLQLYTSIPAYPKMPPILDPPAICVLPASGNYITYGVTEGELPAVMGAPDGVAAATNITLVIMVLVSLAQGYEEMQDSLDELLEPAGNTGSIASAIAQDTTLGRAVGWCVPMEVSTYGFIRVGNTDYFGARIRTSIGA